MTPRVPDSFAGPSPRDEALRHRDEAASELDLITHLLSDRSEPGTYAKAEGLLTAWEARDEAIRTVIAQMRQWVIVQRTDPPSATVTDYTAEVIVGWADELESLVGAIDRQDDKS